MNIVIEVLGGGVLLPFAVSITAAVICRRWLPRRVSRRYELATALSLGFCAGYAALPSWAESVPTRHWHWLPWLAAAAGFVVAIGLARGIWSAERWLLWALLSFTAAWVLVPHWESLEPVRNRYVVALAVYLFVLIAGISPLVDRLAVPLIPWQLAMAAGGLSVAVLVSVSMRYAQLSGVLTAASLGCCVGGLWHTDPRTLRSMVPVWCVVTGGMAFVGFVEPQPMRPALLIIPAAPLVLWFTRWLSPSMDRRSALFIHSTGVALVTVAAVIWEIIVT